MPKSAIKCMLANVSLPPLTCSLPLTCSHRVQGKVGSKEKDMKNFLNDLVRAPTTRTITRHDGPNHLGL